LKTALTAGDGDEKAESNARTFTRDRFLPDFIRHVV
jgi:hypothetical protein